MSDRIADAWELQNFGDLTSAAAEPSVTDPTGTCQRGRAYVDGYTDTDGDGLNDLYEFLAGTDPLRNGDSDLNGTAEDTYEDPDWRRAWST